MTSGVRLHRYRLKQDFFVLLVSLHMDQHNHSYVLLVKRPPPLDPYTKGIKAVCTMISYPLFETALKTLRIRKLVGFNCSPSHGSTDALNSHST